MTRPFLGQFGPLIILGILGGLAYFLLYDSISPKASLDMKYSRMEIMERADDYLAGLGYDIRNYHQDAWMEFYGNTHIFLQRSGGVKYANEVIRADSLPVHRWFITWYDSRIPPSQSSEEFKLWISPGGTILGFDHKIRDSVAKPSLEGDAALALARETLQRRGIEL